MQTLRRKFAERGLKSERTFRREGGGLKCIPSEKVAIFVTDVMQTSQFLRMTTAIPNHNFVSSGKIGIVCNRNTVPVASKGHAVVKREI
jgi:hypothetical protein